MKSYVFFTARMPSIIKPKVPFCKHQGVSEIFSDDTLVVETLVENSSGSIHVMCVFQVGERFVQLDLGVSKNRGTPKS